MQVSSGFLPPAKNMLIGEWATLNHPLLEVCVCVVHSDGLVSHLFILWFMKLKFSANIDLHLCVFMFWSIYLFLVEVSYH